MEVAGVTSTGIVQHFGLRAKARFRQVILVSNDDFQDRNGKVS